MNLISRLLGGNAPDEPEDEWVEQVEAGAGHTWSAAQVFTRTEVHANLRGPVTGAMPTFYAGEACGACHVDLADRTAFYTDDERWLCPDCFRALRPSIAA